MKLINEFPHLCAHCRDGSSWILPLEARDDFEAAWTAGKPFWTGLSARGGTAENTEAMLERLAAEKEEEQRRKMLAGNGD